jgi:hypothetical protein
LVPDFVLKVGDDGVARVTTAERLLDGSEIELERALWCGALGPELEARIERAEIALQKIIDIPDDE